MSVLAGKLILSALPSSPWEYCGVAGGVIADRLQHWLSVFLAQSLCSFSHFIEDASQLFVFCSLVEAFSANSDTPVTSGASY